MCRGARRVSRPNPVDAVRREARKDKRDVTGPARLRWNPNVNKTTDPHSSRRPVGRDRAAPGSRIPIVSLARLRSMK